MEVIQMEVISALGVSLAIVGSSSGNSETHVECSHQQDRHCRARLWKSPVISKTMSRVPN